MWLKNDASQQLRWWKESACSLSLVSYISMFAQKSSSQEYFGDLVVKVGYRTEAEGFVTIFVNG